MPINLPNSHFPNPPSQGESSPPPSHESSLEPLLSLGLAFSFYPSFSVFAFRSGSQSVNSFLISCPRFFSLFSSVFLVESMVK